VPCAGVHSKLLCASVVGCVSVGMGGHGRHCAGGVVPRAGVVGIGHLLRCSLHSWVGVVWPSQASEVAVGALRPFNGDGWMLCLSGGGCGPWVSHPFDGGGGG